MDDRTYYVRRAERQLELAQRATEPAAWNAHYQLATLYRDHARALGGHQPASFAGSADF